MLNQMMPSLSTARATATKTPTFPRGFLSPLTALKLLTSHQMLKTKGDLMMTKAINLEKTHKQTSMELLR
jgi:hypothetical protein